jgi:hypothetical protein
MHIAEPLLLLALGGRLHRRHEGHRFSWLLAGELLRPAHGVRHLLVLGEAGAVKLSEHCPLVVVGVEPCLPAVGRFC